MLTFQISILYLMSLSFMGFHVTSGKNSATNVSILVLAPDNPKLPFALQYVKPAIISTVALITDSPLIFNESYLNPKLVFRDSQCDTAIAINQVFNEWVESDGKLTCIIGPVCDYAVAPIARQIKFWKVPLITPGALSQDFGNKRSKDRYTNLIRIGPTFSSLSRYVEFLLIKYRWRHLISLYERDYNAGGLNRFCYLAIDSIRKHFFTSQLRGNRSRIRNTFETLPRNTKGLTGRRLGKTLKEAVGVNRGAVILICARPSTVVQLLNEAQQLGFNNGEYVFLNLDLFSTKSHLEKPWSLEESNIKSTMKSFRSMFTITLQNPYEMHNRLETLQYKNLITRKRRDITTQGNIFISAFSDSITLLFLAIKNSFENLLINNPSATLEAALVGDLLLKEMRNISFEGSSGQVSMDANGDRSMYYSLLQLRENLKKFHVISQYDGLTGNYTMIVENIEWYSGLSFPPPDKPRCGYDHSKCPEGKNKFAVWTTAVIVLGCILLIVCVVLFYVYRHYKLRVEMAEMNWRITWTQLDFINQPSLVPSKLSRLESRNSFFIPAGQADDKISNAEAISLSSKISLPARAEKQRHKNQQPHMFTSAALYKDSLVAVKRLQKHKHIEVSRHLQMEIKQMRDLHNDHIVKFIGVCIDPKYECILTEYCSRGSLQDILANENLNIDWLFKYSLIQDIVKGMAYLHSSDIGYHGNLKSSNCVVDSRFVLKLTDFGLPTLRRSSLTTTEKESIPLEIICRSKLWTAPELLRKEFECRNPGYNDSLSLMIEASTPKKSRSSTIVEAIKSHSSPLPTRSKSARERLTSESSRDSGAEETLLSMTSSATEKESSKRRSIKVLLFGGQCQDGERLSNSVTQKADVYSFGIVCQEILYRKGTFYLGDDEEENNSDEGSIIVESRRSPVKRHESPLKDIHSPHPVKEFFFGDDTFQKRTDVQLDTTEIVQRLIEGPCHECLGQVYATGRSRRSIEKMLDYSFRKNGKEASELSSSPALSSSPNPPVAVDHECHGIKPLRPVLDMESCNRNSSLRAMIETCWHEDPEVRHDFASLKTILRKINRLVTNS